MKSALLSWATFLSWRRSCFATWRLFAVRCAETNAHVLAPSCCPPELRPDQEVFQAEGVVLLFTALRTHQLKGALAAEDELVRTW